MVLLDALTNLRTTVRRRPFALLFGCLGTVLAVVLFMRQDSVEQKVETTQKIVQRVQLPALCLNSSSSKVNPAVCRRLLSALLGTATPDQRRAIYKGVLKQATRQQLKLLQQGKAPGTLTGPSSPSEGSQEPLAPSQTPSTSSSPGASSGGSSPSAPSGSGGGSSSGSGSGSGGTTTAPTPTTPSPSPQPSPSPTQHLLPPLLPKLVPPLLAPTVTSLTCSPALEILDQCPN